MRSGRLATRFRFWHIWRGASPASFTWGGRPSAACFGEARQTKGFAMKAPWGKEPVMGKGAVLGCGLWLAGISFAATWQIETVDPSGTGKFSSMKADREGNLHVAYIVQDGNEFPLKYAFWDHRLNRWFLMTVDHSAGSCSLALDSQQRPHISYVDFGTAEGSKLHHAYWDAQSGSWWKEAIRLNSEVIAYYTSIVLDAEDHPSISFYEYRGPKDTDLKIRMRVVSWNGTSWMVRTV